MGLSRLIVGLADLEGLSQPKWFYDFTGIWLSTKIGTGDCHLLQMLLCFRLLHDNFSHIYATNILYFSAAFLSLPFSCGKSQLMVWRYGLATSLNYGSLHFNIPLCALSSSLSSLSGQLFFSLVWTPTWWGSRDQEVGLLAPLLLPPASGHINNLLSPSSSQYLRLSWWSSIRKWLVWQG